MEAYKIELAKKNGTGERLYPCLVDEKIRRKYTISAEFAILRQKDEKPDKFAEYNAYAERCKVEAKAELGMEEGT